MRCKLLFRHDVRDLNPSNEGETLRAMPSRRDQVSDLILGQILFPSESLANQNHPHGGRNDATKILQNQNQSDSLAAEGHKAGTDSGRFH